MSKIYITLAVSATMFPETGVITMESLTPEDVHSILDRRVMESEEIVSALNPSHISTIDAIRCKFGINLPIPEKAPKVLLEAGDSVMILQAQLPRLNEGETHSQETVERANISFRLWNVQ